MLDRAAALVVKDRFEFELVFAVSPKHPSGGNVGLLDLRSQLGLRPETKGTVILAEVFVIPEAEGASKADQAERPLTESDDERGDR